MHLKVIKHRLLVRAIAVLSAMGGCLLIGEAFSLTGPLKIDHAQVTGKSEYRAQKGQMSYSIHAVGIKKYNEDVSNSVYSVVAVGDKMELHLTPLFKEWKSFKVYRGDSVIAEGVGSDISALALFALFFFVPVISFDPNPTFGELVVAACIGCFGILTTLISYIQGC
jgi:hypothetical protein